MTTAVDGLGHAERRPDWRAKPRIGDVRDVGLLGAGRDSGGASPEAPQRRSAPRHASICGNEDLAGRGRVEARWSPRDVGEDAGGRAGADRKSTRLNSSHGYISYAVFCLKKKKEDSHTIRMER